MTQEEIEKLGKEWMNDLLKEWKKVLDEEGENTDEPVPVSQDEGKGTS
jgi:hypothetical protein